MGGKNGTSIANSPSDIPMEPIDDGGQCNAYVGYNRRKESLNASKIDNLCIHIAILFMLTC